MNVMGAFEERFPKRSGRHSTEADYIGRISANQKGK
jgi:hypothetical protein